MNLHEYQAKELLRAYDIPVPPGFVVSDAEQACADAGAGPWVVKAQVHSGGRGQAGGIVRIDDARQLQTCVQDLLGKRLLTAQTGAAGLPVNAVLIEHAVPIAHEFYLSLFIDRAEEHVAILASAAGGMDIETSARTQPQQLLRLGIPPAAGLQPYHARRLAFALGLTATQGKQLAQLLPRLVDLFTDLDATLVEVNPLALTAEDSWLALDAKIVVDDSALYRQQRFTAYDDPTQHDAKERAAQSQGLNYIALDGTIACMVNGAGLAMATMDLLHLHGGTAANFLDVGGGADAARVGVAFKIILSDTKVNAVLINIFGGIVRCDEVAAGIIQAARETGIRLPLIVRLEGTRVSEARALLTQSGLPIINADDLTDAAVKAVRAAH